ncbi:MAG: S-adenosylmethionine:tRNA ribosyltransferase-isomerase [Muribaculaceae bacterium]|nr:S-adenosylmethionine:tRNA ribosyltransferase-isomerase [Muribaculaceae bacterium]
MKSNPQDILIEQYDYQLPQERIATHPLVQRDACKLLVYTPGGCATEHIFSDLPSLLPAGATLICNNTRVINARLHFRKETGASIEIFCLEPASPADYAENFACTGCCEWVCLIGNSKRWKSGPLASEIEINGIRHTLTAERICTRGNSWVVRFSWDGQASFAEVITAAGEIPIPPYLNRSTEASDSADYQTVYSHINGSVAAPTAGLHFTPALLENLDNRGIGRLEVTLHVGAGTFQPVKSDAIGDHPMHSEFIAVPAATIRRLADICGHSPVIAVGTTSVRTLESLYHIGCLITAGEWHGEVPQWYPYAEKHPRLGVREALTAIADYLAGEGSDTLVADTRIIIAPGYNYKVVDGMVTNFHQPRSTLLLLVSAFIGDDNWRGVYDYALDHAFRFLSYGDACLFLNK